MLHPSKNLSRCHWLLFDKLKPSTSLLSMVLELSLSPSCPERIALKKQNKLLKFSTVTFLKNDPLFSCMHTRIICFPYFYHNLNDYLTEVLIESVNTVRAFLLTNKCSLDKT